MQRPRTSGGIRATDSAGRQPGCPFAERPAAGRPGSHAFPTRPSLPVPNGSEGSPGSGFGRGDSDVVQMVSVALQHVFEEQGRRALRDEDLGHIDLAEVYGLTPQQLAAYQALTFVVRVMDIQTPGATVQ
jgi:hypothetical protein